MSCSPRPREPQARVAVGRDLGPMPLELAGWSGARRPGCGCPPRSGRGPRRPPPRAAVGRRAAPRAAPGSSTTNRAPPAARLLHPAFPPCPRTSSRTTARPDPAAGHRGRRSMRTNGAQIRPASPRVRRPPSSTSSPAAARADRAAPRPPSPAVPEGVVQQVEQDLASARRRPPAPAPSRRARCGAAPPPSRERARTARRSPAPAAPSGRRSGCTRVPRRSAREYWSTFSTRWASRRASCTITPSAWRRSSSPTTRPSSSVSA